MYEATVKIVVIPAVDTVLMANVIDLTEVVWLGVRRESAVIDVIKVFVTMCCDWLLIVYWFYTTLRSARQC